MLHFRRPLIIVLSHRITRGLVGLIIIACKYAFDALEKKSILLYKNGFSCFESVKDG